jgi:hypothetical protein
VLTVPTLAVPRGDVAAAAAAALTSRRGPARDAVLYGVGAAVVALAGALSEHTIHRAAAFDALPVYLAAVPVALLLTVVAPRFRPRLVLGGRVLIAAAVLIGAGLSLQLTHVVARADDLTGHHSHAETAVIEEGARTLVEGGDPYATTFDEPGIGYWSERIRDHYPYLPAMLVLGLPRVVFDDAPAADARIVFLVATLAALAVAFALWRAPDDRKLLVFQWLLVLPTGTLTMIGGGHDLPVLALMFLSLVLLQRRNLLVAAALLGLAAAMRHNAWILLPFVVMAAGPVRDRVRVGAVSLLTALAVTGPFALWHPDEFIEDVVRWPLNMGEVATNADAPTVGRFIVDQFPTGRLVIVVALLGTVLVAAALVTVRRPPRTASDAALYAGVALLALMVLAPSGRVGYLLYPINLVVWAIALRPTPAGPRTSRPRGRLGPGVTRWYAPRDSNPEPID